MRQHRGAGVGGDDAEAVSGEEGGFAPGAAPDLQDAAAGRKVGQEEPVERRKIGGAVAGGELGGACLVGVEGGGVHDGVEWLQVRESGQLYPTPAGEARENCRSDAPDSS